MFTLYGGKKGYHLTPNGLALQFYAYGYALAPDAAAYESYWSKDHGYHQSPTGSNTVLPGYTEGDITIHAMEPMVKEGEFVNDRELTPYLNFADVSAGEKRRMVAMVRTSGNSGYYVDIFRSDRADNDYLFHHVGTSMEITDSEGSKLPGEALEKFDKTWHEGYHWFSNLHKSDYNQNFIASWSMPEDITARLWMTGGEGREIYQVDAPPTTMNKGLTPGDICMPPMPTPALIVRQEGNNAHTHPFVSVYEAYKKSGPNVLGVEALQGDDGCTGVKVNTADGYADYLFSATDMQAHHPSKRVSFCGGLGLIREKEGQIQLMYLGCGRSLKKGNFVLESDHDVYAAIYMQHGVWYYSATGPVRVKIGKETKELNEGYNQKL